MLPTWMLSRYSRPSAEVPSPRILAARPHLVKAHKPQLAPQVDAQRVDAEDALCAQPTLGIERAHGHGGWQGRRYHHRHQVQSSDHNLPHRHLVGGTVNPEAGLGRSHRLAGSPTQLWSHLALAYPVAVEDDDAVDGAEQSWGDSKG